MPNLKYLFLFAILTVFNTNLLTQTWVQQYSGTNLNLNSVEFLDINTGYIGADSGKVLITTNGGMNWTTINTGFNFNIISIKFYNPAFGIAAGDKIIKTTNFGLSWSVILDTAFANDIYYLDLDNWFIASFLHANKKTTNMGLTWSVFNSTDFISMCLYFLDQNTGYLGSKGIAAGGFTGQHLDKTTNGGMNWTSQYGTMLYQGNGYFYDLYFKNLNTGYGVCSETPGSKILTTTNGGLNWNPTSVQNAQKNIYSLGQSTWTCGYNASVMKSIYKGSSWANEQVTNTGITLNSIFFINSETGWVCGSSGSIYKSTNGGITGLNINNNEIPRSFYLFQNYPNPFNPVTNIKFDLPKSSFIELVIYDELGRIVSTLVKSEHTAGKYSYDWDASDYPSGVYFYRISAGSFSETRKMVLIK